MQPIKVLILTVILLHSCLFAKTSLWQVHQKSNTVYLLGSVHLLKASAYPLDPSIEQAFALCPNLVLELNPDSSETPDAQKFIFSRAVLPNGKSLKSELSETGYRLTDSLCTLVGLDMSRLNLFKPWMVASTIMLLKMQKMGFDANLGVDRVYFKKAQIAGKKILAFETLREQINFIDQLSMPVQEKMVRQMAAEFNTFETSVDEIVKAWRLGDMSGLERLFLESYRQEPQVMEILLKQRNLNWLKKIRTYLAGSENYMIIVGAGHMVGENGLIHLLQKEGYRVNQL